MGGNTTNEMYFVGLVKNISTESYLEKYPKDFERVEKVIYM